MKCLAIALALFAGAAQAETVVGLHLGSQHFPAKDRNNVNPGVYVMHEGWTAGAYYNSFHKPTVYGGYTWSLAKGEWLRLDVTTAVATGYREETGQTLRPIILPSIAFGPEEFRMRVSYGARVKKSSTALVHFSVERSF